MEPAPIIKFSWLALLVVWAIAAFTQRAAAEHAPWAQQLAHKLPVSLGAWILFVPRVFRPWDVSLTLPQPETAWIGAALCLLGLAGAVWSRWTLAGNWSSNVAFKQGHELIERGPYRFVRHPIYTSLLVMALGTAFAQARVGAFIGLLLIFIGFWIKLGQEERLLTRHFPDQYPAYKSRVKALISFVL